MTVTTPTFVPVPTPSNRSISGISTNLTPWILLGTLGALALLTVLAVYWCCYVLYRKQSRNVVPPVDDKASSNGDVPREHSIASSSDYESGAEITIEFRSDAMVAAAQNGASR